MNATAKVRNQLATRNEGGHVPAPSPTALMREAIHSLNDALSTLLPADMKPERYERLMLNAAHKRPELLQCLGTPKGRESLLLAGLEGAVMGLEIDTPGKYAHLLPRKVKGEWQCEFRITARGYLKLALDDPRVKNVFADVVREGDEFYFARGLETDEFRHVRGRERGDLVYAYARIQFRPDGADFEVLDRAQIEKRRAVSDSWRSESARPYSPWTTWTEEMWRKTAIRALLSRLPLSSPIDRAFARDETRLTVTEAGELDALPEPSSEGPEEQDQPAEGEGGTSGDPDPAAEPALPLTIPEGSDSEEVAGG